jgi:hypothetical protein
VFELLPHDDSKKTTNIDSSDFMMVVALCSFFFPFMSPLNDQKYLKKSQLLGNRSTHNLPSFQL